MPKRLPLYLLAFFSHAHVFSQSLPDKKIVHRNILWLSTNASFHFHNNWGLLADISHRRSDFAGKNDLSLARFAVAYWIKPNLMAAAGYAHLWTALSSGETNALLNENRLYQQIILTQKKNKSTFTHRWRIEERWRELEIDGFATNRYAYTTRYRYLFGFRHPLGKGVKSPSVVLAEEIMLHSGKAVKYGAFEQNRLFGGISWKFNPTLSLETGYMYTWQKAINGYQYNSIHTLRITLSCDYLSKKTNRDIHPHQESRHQ